MLQPRPAEAAAPEATEAATAASRRIARALSRAFQSRPSMPIYCRSMLARPRTLPSGFIAPCFPTRTHTLPSGGAWLHETSSPARMVSG